jgi:hypothetical protein
MSGSSHDGCHWPNICFGDVLLVVYEILPMQTVLDPTR